MDATASIDGPDFVGIGAQKAGTTWLHVNLNEHPDIWLPPTKEIHYFDGLGNMGQVKRNFNAFLKNSLDAKEMDWEKMDFMRHFVFEVPKGTAWYKKLFQYGNEKVHGEITPAYSIVGRERIEELKTINPKVKIILLLRDPIERAWSNLRFDARKMKEDPNSWSEEKINEFLNKADNIAKTSYATIINNWRAVFSENQMLIRFYDEIKYDQMGLLKSVCDFLEVEFKQEYFKNVERNPSKGLKFDIPPKFEKYLAEKYIDDTTALAASLGGYATQWVERMNNIIA